MQICIYKFAKTDAQTIDFYCYDCLQISCKCAGLKSVFCRNLGHFLIFSTSDLSNPDVLMLSKVRHLLNLSGKRPISKIDY